MNADQRPDPDALLQAVQREERHETRGTLKIFLGMCAGVGKTYAMLNEAREKHRAGLDVAAAVVETHGRRETEAMLTGLTRIPKRKFDYRGVTLEEMDLDAVLACKPALVLVDELAHTNAPGSRHPKRYQDIQELLAAGIDVYTTVNVQHFESRSGTVAEITGVPVRETVPDSLLEDAEVKLVDLHPEDLIERLRQGKVYLGERAARAEENFFRIQNLTALRDMSLRLTAERVEQELDQFLDSTPSQHPWKSHDRLLVAVSASPHAERLIRWTRRMAYGLSAHWVAVYVETSRALSAVDAERLETHLNLARELGAEVVTVRDEDIPGALIRTAERYHATQIIVGKPMDPVWKELLTSRSPINELVRRSGRIDIYICQGDDSVPPPAGPRVKSRSMLPAVPEGSHWAWGLLALALTTALGLSALPVIGYWSVALLYMTCVLLVGVRLERPVVWTISVLAAVCWNVLFIPPRFTLHVDKVQDMLMLVLFFLVAFITGNLTTRLRASERAMGRREEETYVLYRLASEVGAAMDMDGIVGSAVACIRDVFGVQACVWLAGEPGRLQAAPHPASHWLPSEKDAGVAVWAFEHRQPAGRFTQTLPEADAYFTPLLEEAVAVGVLGVLPSPGKALGFTHRNLLETLCKQLALAIRGSQLKAERAEAEQLRASQALYKTLLNSISHELKTPLAAIQGAVSALQNPRMDADTGARHALISEMDHGAHRLERLVANLLDMTRLESGHLAPRLDWCDVNDLMQGAVERMGNELSAHSVAIHAADSLPLVRLDMTLMEQALVNLLHNAAVYTPPGTLITLDARMEDGQLLIRVSDNGPGVPPEVLPRLFDKFYRAPGAATGGTGLGLSIVKGLVEAHGGSVSAHSPPGGGLLTTLRLPASQTPPPAPEAAHD